jgi:hypothetical protein
MSPLIDAARVVKRVWRPMTAWSVLVRAVGLLLLSPLTVFALGRPLGAGGLINEGAWFRSTPLP